MRVAIPTGLILLLLGQADAITKVVPWGDLAVGGSAVAILGWVAYYLLTKTVPDLRKSMEEQQSKFSATLDRLCDRHERWEEARHADSAKLDETLRENSQRADGALRALAENCAAARADFQQDRE